MLIQFANGKTLYSHNQLYGVWRIVKLGHQPKTNRALRASLNTDTHSAMLFSATDVELWSTDKLYKHPFLKKLRADCWMNT
jgi:endonuclease-8